MASTLNRLGSVAFLALLAAGAGCERRATYAQSREVMGTLAAVTAVAPDRATAQAAVEAAYARLNDVNSLMSDYVADSEIGRLNRLSAGQALEVSPETFACLERGLEICRLRGGAFDPTCRPLVELWRQAALRRELPAPQEIAAAQARVGWQMLKLDGARRTVALSVEGMQVDLGAIAKGYACDLAAEAMKRAGATGGLVDVGGDIVAFGMRQDGKPWRIGVRHPFQDGLFAKLELTDAAVATSGVQQRFYEIDGKRYSHILDPRTGWPAEQSPSVTVIAADGLTADAWATALSVLSVAEGQALIEAGRAPGVEAMWISGTAAEPTVTQTRHFGCYVVD